MSCLHYQGNFLYIENVSFKELASKFDTPSYVYSKDRISKNWHAFTSAFKALPHRVCYAVKANSNLTILNLLAKLGASFDIVSIGELERVIHAGGDAKKIIFSGVGKKSVEIIRAMQLGIYCFDVESQAEIERLQSIAAGENKLVNIALRINPNINPHTHQHISTGLEENKFGIPLNEVMPLCKNIASYKNLQLIGIASHIGSQITSLEPFILACKELLTIYEELKKLNITLRNINLGGGLGITYHNEHPPKVAEYAAALKDLIGKYPLEIILEPGRAIVGDAGVLLTRVEYIKHKDPKNFVIVDAGMNDLMRPALYNAWQDILVTEKHSIAPQTYDIAGPVCESADFLGKERSLAVKSDDLLVIDCAGAYGFSMCSNYNSRCKPAEVLVDDNHMHLIRERETISDLFAKEILGARDLISS